MDSPRRGHHDGLAPGVGHEFYSISVLKMEIAKVCQCHIDIKRFSVTHAAHANVGNAIHGQGISQKFLAVSLSPELIPSGLTKQTVGRN